MKSSFNNIETKHLLKSISEFSKMAYAQERKGIEKYGKPLDPLDNYDWLKMAKEEQVDGFKYLEAELEKRTFVIEKIKKLTAYECKPSVFTEINHWLDLLEGK